MLFERFKPLLLDTHIFVWLMNGEKRLGSSSVRYMIEDAVSNHNVYISMISVWEIAMLESKKRLVFNVELDHWISRAIEITGIQILPITREIAISSTRLPGGFHGDPADRLIVASANCIQAGIVTNDHEIIKYCSSHDIPSFTV